MKIVVLDGYTLNPGDLSWEAMEKLGEMTVYDRTPDEEPSEVIRRAANAQIALTNKTFITEETLQQLPKLKYIGVLATGYNVVDMEAATARGYRRDKHPGLQHAFGRAVGFCSHLEPGPACGRTCRVGPAWRLVCVARLRVLELSAGRVGMSQAGDRRLRPDRSKNGCNRTGIRDENLG